MAAALKPVSPSVVNDYIAAWRRARRDSDAGKLYYPKINILHPEHGVGEEDDVPHDTAAEVVQRIVEKMPPEMRRVFEAHHLAIINGDSCRGTSPKFRQLALGIQTKEIYEGRERSGWAFIRDRLSLVLDIP